MSMTRILEKAKERRKRMVAVGFHGKTRSQTPWSSSVQYSFVFLDLHFVHIECAQISLTEIASRFNLSSS